MKNELIISIIFFIALIVSGFLFFTPQPPVVEEKIFYKENPLEKNKEFSIEQGVTFVYTAGGNYSGNFTFSTAKGNGCTWIYAEGGELISCVNKYGIDESGSNISLSDSALFFFKPWMLALHDNWQWNANACIMINKEAFCDMPVFMKVIRVDYLNGKKNYVVKITFINTSIYQWVEDERRIVTKEIGDGYEITLKEPSLASQQAE